MSDGNGLAEALLGLDGFRVLAVVETVELVVVVESVVDLIGCSSCGVWAEAQDRVDVEVRDLACRCAQAFYKWRARPMCDRDWADAHLTNAIIDIHADDPEFGYRFIADELEQAGHRAGERGGPSLHNRPQAS